MPVAYGHREVWIRGYVHEVVIGCGGGIIARHPRLYERDDMVFDPIHYLPLLEQKIAALDQARFWHEWTEILGSERLTGALLDRLTHHVHILEMNGESYRQTSDISTYGRSIPNRRTPPMSARRASVRSAAKSFSSGKWRATTSLHGLMVV